MQMNAKSHVSRRDLVSAAVGGAAGLALGHALKVGKRNDSAGKNEVSSSKTILPAVPKDSNILMPRTTVNLSAFGCADAIRLRINGDPVHRIRKDFELLGGRGRESKLSRLDHPEMQIESAQVKGTNLHLFVRSEPNKINMLEVAVDGVRRDEAIVGDFGHIVLDLGSAARTARQVAVRGYDRYLQCAEQTVKIEQQT